MNLSEKIQKIEALIERASTEGERQAAECAKRRLQERIEEHAIEYKISSHSTWEKRLFVAICKKNGIETYRYARQKRTTTMLKTSPSLMEEFLWPEYTRYAELLREAVNEISNGLIDQIYCDQVEETVISGELASK